MLLAVALVLLSQYFSSEAKVAELPLLRYNDGIVGGEDIDISEAPYQVSLQVRGRHYCGGTLVAENIVISAAHCVKTVDASSCKIRAGSSFSERDGELYPVEKVLPHPKFDFEDLDSDIAIIWLSKPVKVSDKIGTVEMKGVGEEVPDGDTVQVTGWGSTDPVRSLAYKDLMLQRVLIPKISDSKCRDAYGNSFTKNMLCAGLPEGGKNACFGDSGGPLIHNNKLAGVVSFGKGCARPDYPAVYAKVSALREWIDEQLH